MNYPKRRAKRYTSGADPAATYLQDQQDSKEQAKKNEAYAAEQAGRQAKEKELNDLQGDFEKMPELLRTRYTADAQRAGTYSSTGEFASGLDSEIEAGIPGARASNMSRQQALQRELGLPESVYDTSTVEPALAPAVAPTAAALPSGQPVQPNTLEDDEAAAIDPTTGQPITPRQKAIQNQLGGSI